MAEEKESKQEEQPKKSFLKWIILAVLVIVIAGGGFAGWTFFMKKDATANTEETSTPEPKRKDEPRIILPLESFIVNLFDQAGQGKRYLKVTMQIEVGSQTDVEDVGQNKTRIKDAVLMLLSSLSFDDINSMDGKLELKQALIQQLNQILKHRVVYQVYFTEFVVQ